MEVDWFGERLVLLAERAVYWPARDTLLLADVHLGKDAAFRWHGIAIPAGIGQADLRRLTSLVQETAVRCLIVLGDLIHSRTGLTEATNKAVTAWRGAHPELEVTLVRGNHDRSAGDPPADWRIQCVSEPYALAPFLLRHIPSEEPEAGPEIAGHLHPAVTLTGPANTHMTLPCFWMSPRRLVLPAFTAFAGRPTIAVRPGDRIFVTGEGEVAEVNCRD